MGIFSTIFGGGGGPKADPYTANYERSSNSALSNMLGGVSTYKDAKGRTKYNFGEGFKDLSGAKGVQTGTQGYDFSPVDSAMAAYKNPASLTQAYNPTTFNYADPTKLNQASDLQYGSDASAINRAGQSNLEANRQAIGTRRPGLLAKTADQNSRSTLENLSKLRSQYSINALNQGTELQKDQQQAQAGENYKGYQSQADLEKSNVDNAFRNNQALAETGQNKISTQAGLVQNERSHQDQLMKYLTDMFYNTAHLNQGAQQLAGQKSSGILGTVAGLAGTAAKAFAG